MARLTNKLQGIGAPVERVFLKDEGNKVIPEDIYANEDENQENITEEILDEVVVAIKSLGLDVEFGSDSEILILLKPQI